MTHLSALPLGQLSATPWSFHPAWFLVLACGLPALIWLGLAWKRALDADPHRLRRAGLRQVRRLLARVERTNSSPGPLQLHSWCQAAARTWGVHVSAPSRGQVAGSLDALTGEGETTRWMELWSSAERALYADGGPTPADWTARASTAAAGVQLPKRERWLPDRFADWFPNRALTSALTLGWVLACAAPLSSHADQTPSAVSQQDQQMAAQAIQLHWNDWAAHYNIAAAQIAQGNWNYAVAHAATAFLLEPTSSANRDNLRFAIQQSGSMDPTLRRLLYGPWFQQFPGLLSPAGWQHLSLFASLVVAAGFSAFVVMLYFPRWRRRLSLGGGASLAGGGVLLIIALLSFNDYGMLARADSGILVQPVNLSPSPTELVPEAETIPASAGVVVLPERAFMGWRKVSPGVNVSGWLRANAVMPFYGASRH